MNLFVMAVLITPSAGLASAPSIYIANTKTVSADGSTCARAYGIDFFNSSANWGTGTNQIGPGTTVHICGVISAKLVSGSGAVGRPVTLLFERGAMLSQPAGAVHLSLMGVNNVIVDGGQNGVIENTANGTGASAVSSRGIDITGSSAVEIRNLTIRNLYRHSSLDDTGLTIASGGAIYANGSLSTISIHDNHFSDVGWVINLQCTNNVFDGIKIHNNTFANYDHGVAFGVVAGSHMSNVSIYGNYFGSTVNWDTIANTYHHDGIHVYATTGGDGRGFEIYNNVFSGDWGSHTTAQIFIQLVGLGANVYNNVCLNTYNRYLTNGHMALNLGAGSQVYNNTIVGSGTAQKAACVVVTGTNLTMKNNLISNCAGLINIKSGTSFTPGGLDYNMYRSGQGPLAFYKDSTWYNSSRFSDWQAATGEGRHSSYSDAMPSLNAGIPQAGSELLGTGVNLFLLQILSLNADVRGMVRPAIGGWDIGAYQHSAGPNAPTGLSVVVH